MNLNTSSFENSPANSETLTTTAPRRLLTATEAALFLGIAAHKLDTLRHGDVGPDWVQLGRIIRYIPDDLDWWLEQSGAKSA